jgi:hypothetical protein
MSGGLGSNVYIEILHRTGTAQMKATLEIIKHLKEHGRPIVPVGKTVCFRTLILSTKKRIKAEAGL